MPASLASNLVDQLGMTGVVRFSGGMECVYREEAEVLKLFHPQSVRILGGRATDRRVDGSIGFVLRSEVAQPGRGRAIARPSSMSLCPAMNFPALIVGSAITEGRVAPGFSAELNRYLDVLPGTEVGIATAFGPDFFAKSDLDRLLLLVDFIRQQA
jgi:hypothetical protein